MLFTNYDPEKSLEKYVIITYFFNTKYDLKHIYVRNIF